MSRHAAALALALLLVPASTALAASKYPPGPGYRSCPDSVTLFQVQQSDTTMNPCYPALGDTVAGVRGIITAFRPRSTGRIYIENRDAGDYHGLQVYTVGHLESAGFALGDSVSVFGLSQAYQGESQLQGLLGTSLTVRMISSGIALPPYRLGTTTDYRWAPAAGPGSAYATCNPREGELVAISGPLRVARTQAGAGLFSGTNWLLVNADGTAPGDSVLVDGYTLTLSNINAPPLGSIVSCLFGILRRATNNGVDSWIVTLRDVNDQSTNAPPSLSDAFPVAENTIRLLFDRNLDLTTAQNASNYSLGSGVSGSTVDAATVVGGSGSMVDLTITDVLPRLSSESVTASGITAAAGGGGGPCASGGSGPSSAQTMNFVLGILTCAEVQAALPESLSGACIDKSRFAGGGSAWANRLTVRGEFVQSYGTLYYLNDHPGGVRGGVAAYNVPFAMVQNHQYLLACRVQEFYTETELANPAYLIDEGAVTAPVPILVQPLSVLVNAACDATQSVLNAEDYEGCLVKVVGLKVVPFNTEPTEPQPGGSFRVVQLPARTDTILVSSLGERYTYDPSIGDCVDVTGILHIDTDVPRLLPRSDADIEYIGLLGGGCSGDMPPIDPTRLSLAVTPNPARTAHIAFQLPRQATVDLAIVDLAGRRVATLASGPLPAGAHQRTWTAAGARPGVYFVRLRAGGDSYVLRTVHLE
jgi:hypothetical protein